MSLEERSATQTGDCLNISGISMPASCFRRCIFILNELLSCYDCFQFLTPIPLTAVVYHREIKQPMDFATLENNLYANEYNTYNDFYLDLALIWNNAKLFHRSFDLIYQQAENLLNRYSGLVEFLNGGQKPFYLSTSPSDIEYLLSNPLPEELLVQENTPVIEDAPVIEEVQLQQQASIVPFNAVLPMYKEIEPPSKTNLYFVQALSEEDNNTKKLRGFSNVRQLFQHLNASFFKYMASPSNRYTSPPLPRFYIAKNRTLLTEAGGDLQGVLAVLCNVQIKPLNKDLYHLQATVVIAEPMGETHGFDESTMNKSDEYEYCPKAWSKLKVIKVVDNVNTVINADIDRNFFKKFYNTYKLSTKGSSDLKKVGNDDVAKQFVASILNPKASAAAPIAPTPPPATSASRKQQEPTLIKIKKENTTASTSLPPMSTSPAPPAEVAPTTTTTTASGQFTAPPTALPAQAAVPIIPRKRGRPPKANKKRTQATPADAAPTTSTPTTTHTHTATTINPNNTNNGRFNPIIYTSGSPAAAAAALITTSVVATPSPRATPPPPFSPSSTTSTSSTKPTTIRIVLNKIRSPSVVAHESSETEEEKEEDPMEVDEQKKVSSANITTNSSTQNDVDVPSPARLNTTTMTAQTSSPTSSSFNHTASAAPTNIANSPIASSLNNNTTTTPTNDDVDVPSPSFNHIAANNTTATTNTPTSTTTDDADVPSRSQTITIPIEVYDAATAIDTNTTTSTNTYEEEMMDTEEAPLYEPYVSERSMENRATADFSNVYDSDVVKAHWKKLKDYADEKNVPIVDLKTYQLKDAGNHNAEGYFKRVYFVKSDPTKVVQTFRRMTIAQRTTEVVSLLALKGLPHMGQITEVLVRDKANGDYEVLGLTMKRYEKTLKQYAHPHSHHRLTAHQKMDLVRQMLECMDTIHKAGLAHRDLSEVNFMVNASTTEKLSDGSAKAHLVLIDFGKSVFTRQDQVRQWWIEHPQGLRDEEYDGEIVPLTQQELDMWCQQLPWIRSKPDHGYRLYRSIQTLPRNRTDAQDLQWLVNPVAEDMYSTGTLIWKIFSETEPWYGILDTDLKGLRETVGDDYHIEKAFQRQVSGKLSKELLLKMIKVTPDQRGSATQVMDWIKTRETELLEEWVVNAPVERKKRHAKRYDDEGDINDKAGPSSPPSLKANKRQKRHHTNTTNTNTTTTPIPPLKLRF